ncbi:hypothetical protein BGX30_006112, partial [Mortierella sp. GBA39]
MRSDMIKKGFDRAPHRSLLRAAGVKEEDFGKPFIAVCNSYIDIVPGHVHLQEFGKLVKEAIREAGGVPGGPMKAGVDSKGRRLSLTSVFEGVGAHQVGKISDDDLLELEQYGCPTCGSCSGMFTANSMNCLAEALGLAMPGNGTILAVAEERREFVKQSARQLMELVKMDLKPRDIVTKESIDNAFALDMAMGGSTNT